MAAGYPTRSYPTSVPVSPHHRLQELMVPSSAPAVSEVGQCGRAFWVTH